MYTDDQYVQISAMEHYSYCPRQCALIHSEQIYDENVFTLRGNKMHERADQRTTRTENGLRIERALKIWSDRYGIVGTADVVEFSFEGKITPVEYKPGTRPVTIHDDIQLCAQAICLEEMYGIPILTGALYSGAKRRRRIANFNGELRAKTIELTQIIRGLTATNDKLPPVLNDERCRNCSLRESCMPEILTLASRMARSSLFRTSREKDITGEG